MSDTGDWVLVVEDNAMNADVLRENLEEVGYRYVLAVNGAAGVAKANELLPDIILMDINLPILDGLSATRLLKGNSPTQFIPVIALTARAMSGDREICLAAGCDDYISKPVDIDILFGKMRHHMTRRPPGFVEMIHRQRVEPTPSPQPSPGLKPGMEAKDYEEEFASLNGEVESLEAELKLARLRINELDERIAERDQQIASLLEEQKLRHNAGAGASDSHVRLAKQLDARNRALKRAFLRLHRTVVKATEEAMEEIAFGDLAETSPTPPREREEA